MTDQKFRMVVAGGGSGGHVYPTLAIVDALQKRFTDLKFPLAVTRMGPSDGYDALFQGRGVSVSPIMGGKLRRYASVSNILDIPKFFIGFVQAMFKLYFIMPDVVFSKGGTGALPVVIAAWIYRIPIAIHESDAKPGLNNLFSARFAKKVFVSFADASKYFAEGKVVMTGSPIRPEVFADNTTKQLAKENLGFSSSNPLMLVIGGSQGSTRINDFILSNLSTIIVETQILHQTGVANFAEVQKLSRAALMDQSFKNRYQAIGYIEKTGVPFTAADIVVSRASSTIFEIAAFGLPAILVPLAESANDHQRANAYAYAKTGAAIVIEEANLLSGIFLAQLKLILGDPERLAKMSEAATAFFVPNAADTIAQALIALAAGN